MVGGDIKKEYEVERINNSTHHKGIMKGCEKVDAFRLSTNINLVPNIGNLQAQLDNIGKQLKMNISNINLSAKGALTTSSVDKLILRYKAGRMAIQDFIKYSQQMVNSSNFTNKSLQDQAKIVQSLGNAQKQLTQQQTQSTQQTQQRTQTTRQQTQAMIQNEKVAQQQAKTAMMQAKAQEALAKAQLAQLKIQQQQNVLTQQAAKAQQQAAKSAQQAARAQQTANKAAQQQAEKTAQRAARASQQQTIGNQQTISSLDKLIARYNTYKITLDQFARYLTAMKVSETWRNKTLQEQAKLIRALERAERDRAKALTTGVSAQQQQYLSRISGMQVGKTQIFNTAPVQTAMNNLINSVKTLGTVGGKTTKQINAEMARFTNTIRQAESAEKALNFQQKQLQSLQRMQVGRTQLFNTPAIQQELQTLMASIRSVGTQGGKSMAQVTQEMARFSVSVRQASYNTAQLRKETNSFLGNIGGLLKKFADWMIVGTAIMQTIRFVREGIKYVYELDGALNEIRIVTGQTQTQVEKLALSYNALAKSMGVTTIEVAKTSVELYRQGLNAMEVEDRMRSIIQYAKISSIPIEESNKIITATMNSMGTSAQRTIDVMSMLGGFRPAA